MFEPIDFEEICNNYEHIYMCKNPEKFNTLINTIQNKRFASKEEAKQLLQDYISDESTLGDYMMYEGEAFIEECVSIPVAIIRHGSIEMFEAMLELDPSLIDYHDNTYSLLAHSIDCYRHNMSELLLEKGADPNQQGKRSKTPLYQAINNENLEFVEKLLEKGADPNMVYSVARMNYLTLALTNYVNANIKMDRDLIGKIVKALIKANAEPQMDKYDEKMKTAYKKLKRNL